MALDGINFLRRLYTSLLSPPVAPKSSDAIRFGILGAANIAPQALIKPALSHGEVIIAAIAARDPKKAETFARKHGIPIVHKTYEDLIADPSIEAVYIPLPNGLHYEWAVKSLEARKHVLLEKPSVSNAEEARSLFHHPILSQPNAPVLLEAFHYRFHPAWLTFLAQFDSKDVEEVESKNSLFAGVFAKNDIRFTYDLAGGTLMDFGTYAVNSMRTVFACEPTAVASAVARLMPDGFDKKCDEAMSATYEFPNGGKGKISTDLRARGGYWFPALTKNWPSFAGGLPLVTVKLREKNEGVENGLEMFTQKTVIMVNFMGPHLYHRIDVVTSTTWRDQQSGSEVKSERKVDYLKAYAWPRGSDVSGSEKKGEEWWPTYRYQLEEFVNRVKKREGSGAWVDHEDSIRQSECLDATYEKAGLPLRPTCKILGRESVE